ncbi:glycoside hydrolase family 43 protein [candidate division KSB1 bacterium]|nr:glycoside hydrolase family 43 protein [candidate division KSB1 bacterium]
MLGAALISAHCAKQPAHTYHNPILAGFYPDPSMCRVGDDYYIVNSTFAYYPGIPIFHSTDLVNWTQLGHVLDRPEQLNLDGLGVSRGIFAPALRYHDGVFYVTCTVVDGGGNFVVTAKNPAGPWSTPVWLPEVHGIDPSLFFDDDGKTYLIYNSDPPEQPPLYQGHRALWMYEFDTETLTVIGERRLIVNGGSDISQKPIWIEGPHIFNVDGTYYLSCAEGGTAADHSQVVFKATTVWGPYESYSGNPIMTQRQLDPEREHPITCVGHMDMVQIPNGDWWAIFLGCRPYEGDYTFNTGRETFMAPVTWRDGWPTVLTGDETVKYSYPVPALPAAEKAPYPLNGNFTVRDEFDSDKLGYHWMFLRTVREPWYSLADSGTLTINLRPETINGVRNPSFIARRQQHINCYAETKMEFTPQTDNETAGLIAFQGERFYYYLGLTMADGKPMLQLKNNTEIIQQVSLSEDAIGKSVYLKIEAAGAIYRCYYAIGEDAMLQIGGNLDGTLLSTNTAGGFVGAVFGMYASSQGTTSTNKAVYGWFEYSGDDVTFE